jgi:phenylalanyl-tRNA synthetase beta chain
MKISLNWLKRYVHLEVSAQELENVLPMLGFEVDAIIQTGLSALKHVVVGEILSRVQHPNADRLSVCEVNVGSEPVLSIVCGATNYKVGDRVPVALPGALLPGNFEIKESKLRGVLSQGMMCSPSELGLTNPQKGLLILENNPAPGTPINDLFPDGDCVLELAVTANRGDALSHIGIARELAAYYGLKLHLPELKQLTRTDKFESNTILKHLSVEDTLACPLYGVVCFSGAKNGITPEWMRKDLESVGVGSINAIVDITNWVLFETGQPLHAFDADKIETQSLVVRRAKKGERTRLLNGTEYTFESHLPLVIADNQKPIVVAGIMGSTSVEVDENTTRIILESAYFNPSDIRRSSRDLGVSSDSSYRFERDVDPAGISTAAERAASLISEITGATIVSPLVCIGSAPRKDRTIEVTPEFIRKIFGFSIDDKDIAGYMTRAGFHLETISNGWRVTVPSFRSDVTRPIDLAEEVLRFYGTLNIPQARVCLPSLETQPVDDDLYTLTNRAMNFLSGRGFAECFNYTLRSQDEVEAVVGKEIAYNLRLNNVLSADQSHLRTSLIPGLLNALAINLDYKNDVRALSEFGEVFACYNKCVHECVSIAFVVTREPSVRLWNSEKPTDFPSLKPIIEEIAQLANLAELNWSPFSSALFHSESYAAHAGDLEKEGFSAELGLVNTDLLKMKGLNPNTVWAGEIRIALSRLKSKKTAITFKAFSDFPAVKRDIALVVSQTMLARDVQNRITTIAQSLLNGQAFSVENIGIFDVYTGAGIPEGTKSLAFSLTLRSSTGTLTDEQVEPFFTALIKKLSSEFTLRTA